jgi:hypothetical protein
MAVVRTPLVQCDDARTSEGEEETGQRLVHQLHLTESILGESRERGATWHTASVLSSSSLLKRDWQDSAEELHAGVVADMALLCGDRRR